MRATLGMDSVSSVLLQKEITSFGEDCFLKHQICKIRYDLKSAAYYLDLRAKCDTSSVRWAMDAGRFVVDYQYDYGKSLKYYQTALRNALIQTSSQQSEDIADCYYNIASIFVNEANYHQAYNYYRDALNLRQHLYGPNAPQSAEVIEQIGMIYNSIGEYNIALEHIEKAYGIYNTEYKDVYIDTHLANCNENLGVVLDNLGEYEQAKEYTDKALHLFIKLYSPNDIKVAACHSNLGGILENLEDTENAIENYSKSIEIYLENHREYEAAVVYNNVGTLYYNVGEFNKAHDSFKQAVQLIRKHEAEDHPVYRKIIENMEEVKLKLQHVSD